MEAWRSKRLVAPTHAGEPQDLHEAKAKLPNPANMVPVYHWTKQHIWVFVKAWHLILQLSHGLLALWLMAGMSPCHKQAAPRRNAKRPLG